MRILGAGCLAALALIGGCSMIPGRSSVSGDWSCRALGQTTCHSISENDVRHSLTPGARMVTGTSLQSGGIDADRPTLYGRNVLRVSILPWIDTDGHYHAAATVFAPVGEDIWGEPMAGEVE